MKTNARKLTDNYSIGTIRATRDVNSAILDAYYVMVRVIRSAQVTLVEVQLYLQRTPLLVSHPSHVSARQDHSLMLMSAVPMKTGSADHVPKPYQIAKPAPPRVLVLRASHHG